MKVYVVIYEYYEMVEVLGVFTDEDEANKLVAGCPNHFVRESTLDPSELIRS